MTGVLIDGKSIADKIHQETAARVAELKQAGFTPALAVILVGNDKPSHTYVRMKGKAAAAVGLNFVKYAMPEHATTSDVVQKINTAQADVNLAGLIVQLPLPDHIDTKSVLAAIQPAVDIDCLTDENIGKLVMNTNLIAPPTADAVMSILQNLNVDLVGKNVTIIGVGPLVGKPLAIMMMNARASVTTCNSKTKDTKAKCLAADIIVTGVGKKDILRGDMVRPGAIVIDTGVDFVDGVMYGDANVAEVQAKAAYVTPTPGGVGPLTIARLLWNTALLAERNCDANLRMHANIEKPTE